MNKRYQQMQKILRYAYDAVLFTISGVARAFPGGRVAHPEDQNEEENEENLRKNERNYGKMRKYWGNILILPTRGVRGWLRPCLPLTDILPVLKSSVNLKQTLTVHTSHFSEVMFSRTNLQWRSQGLPGWANRPPGEPKWGKKWEKFEEK